MLTPEERIAKLIALGRKRSELRTERDKKLRELSVLEAAIWETTNSIVAIVASITDVKETLHEQKQQVQTSVETSHTN